MPDCLSLSIVYDTTGVVCRTQFVPAAFRSHVIVCTTGPPDFGPGATTASAVMGRLRLHTSYLTLCFVPRNGTWW